MQKNRCSDLYCFSSQDEERLRSLGEEAGKFVNQDVLNLVCLLYPDADTNAVDAWLDEDLLILIARNGERIQQHFWRALCFDFGNVVSF